MSKEKFSKVEVKSRREDDSAASENTQSLLSFDIYFQKLMAMRRALAHHKAPMKKFAEQNEMLEASEEEFENLFKSY